MTMLEWLKRDPRALPIISIAGNDVPITIRRMAKARRLTMRLAPDGHEVRISMPRWGRTADALNFAQSRIDWLENQMAVLPGRVEIRSGSFVPYRGMQCTILHNQNGPRRVNLAVNTITLGGPLEALATRLRRWLESEARLLLAADLADYCRLAEQPLPKLALSSAQRRWGSCAASGTIRINWRLIMAPDFVRRSVVAHEVAHLVHFDHSSSFYGLLDQIFESDIQEANQWLKRHGRSLYAAFG